jgi:hypothetical protein
LASVHSNKIPLIQPALRRTVTNMTKPKTSTKRQTRPDTQPERKQDGQYARGYINAYTDHVPIVQRDVIATLFGVGLDQVDDIVDYVSAGGAVIGSTLPYRIRRDTTDDVPAPRRRRRVVVVDGEV